jgi:hypothetical protein
MDLTPGMVRDLLRGHGLEIVATQPIGAWMYRARIMATARASGSKERFLESLFGSSLWSPIAPDTIILARKR